MSAGDLAADVTMARTMLRASQARWASGTITDPSPTTPREVAAERAARRKAESQPDGDFVRVGAFRYAAAIEAERWQQTDAVIDRVDPGPFEDGGYLEFLARQAATVEMTIRHMALLPDADALDGILLGTVGQPRSEATTSSIRGSKASVISLSAGMVYLMYQAAKAVVTSWQVKEAPAGSGVAFSSRPEDTAAVLDADGTPIAQLVDTLLAWFASGVARPVYSTAPAAMYHPPLEMLTNFAERFVIAHEYCHALFDHFRLPTPDWLPAEPANSIEREMRADLFATAIVGVGASEFDRMAPNMALQGAMLAMKIHQIADEAIEMVTGIQPGYAEAISTHPPFDVRSQLVFDAYQGMLADPADERLAPEALLIPARTADELWARGRSRVEAFTSSGTPLHPIWTKS